MLPPERIDDRRSVVAGDATCEESRERRGSGALDDELRPLGQEHDRLADLLVGDGDDRLEQASEQARRQLARVLDGDALGDRVAELRAAREWCARGRLDADDFHLWSQRPQREPDARREAAAADRNDDRLHLGQLLDELEADRPLAGDHVEVLERMHERRAGLLHVGDCRRDRVLERRSGQLGARAVVARRLDLRHRRLRGHEDRGLDPGLARGPRDRLAVVAGTGRDDARLALGLAQRSDLVDGAANLERARALERLGLQVHGAARHAAEGLRGVERRHAHALPREACARGLYVSECRGCFRRQA